MRVLLAIVATVAVAALVGAALISHQSSASPAEVALRTTELDYLLPRNGDDARRGANVAVFDQKVVRLSATRCLKSYGLPAAPMSPSMAEPFGSAQFPDISRAAVAHSLGLTNVLRISDPAATLRKASAVRYRDIVQTCEEQVLPQVAILSTVDAASVVSQWIGDYYRILQSPAVVEANAHAEGCSGGTAFGARSVVGEIFDIEGKVAPLMIGHEFAEARSVQARGVAVLARCFGEEQEVIDRDMAGLRPRFVYTHRAELDRLLGAANATIDHDHASYGVSAP